MKYNWQHADWPNFTYDISSSLASLHKYSLEAARLSGGLAQLQNDAQYEAYVDLMVSEAINTSQIEGENLDREDIRSSIRNYLGLSTPRIRISDPRAEGIAALMVDVRKSFNEPLTEVKLCQWHQMVITEAQQNSLMGNPIKVGQWRTSDDPMQIISGPIGYEKVHYEAPPAQQVAAEMSRFLQWYQNTNPINPECSPSIPGPVRSAIAHLWFLSIHPFDDGNGRVGRAIAEQALAQGFGQASLLSLSTTIAREKNDYYNHLHKASESNLNITHWVNWFCDAVARAQNDAVQKIDYILQKAKFWNTHRDTKFNQRQEKVVRKMFDVGPNGFEFGINARKYQGMTSTSKATATRDLADLVNKGCLVRLEGGGRNARYGLNLANT